MYIYIYYEYIPGNIHIYLYMNPVSGQCSMEFTCSKRATVLSFGWGYHREVTWRNGNLMLYLLYGYGSIPMKIPCLMGWTSILTQLFWCEQKGYYWFWHTAISILIFFLHCFVCHSWCLIFFLSHIVMISSSGQLVVVIYCVKHPRFAEWKDDSNYRPVNSHILFGNMGFSIENTATQKIKKDKTTQFLQKK